MDKIKSKTWQNVRKAKQVIEDSKTRISARPWIREVSGHYRRMTNEEIKDSFIKRFITTYEENGNTLHESDIRTLYQEAKKCLTQ